MRSVLIIVLVAFGLNATGQKKTESFYKDYFLNKEVPEKKAKFKKVVIKDPDGKVTTQTIDLSTGCVRKVESYRNEIPVGEWVTCSEDCKVEIKRNFSKLVYSDKQIDTLFNNVIWEGNPGKYVKAQYDEDENAILNYLAKNIRYPMEAKIAGHSGIVYLQFIIKADGSIYMVSITRGASPFLDYESWQLLESMPKWNPATKDGKPIASYYNLPVRFVLR